MKAQLWSKARAEVGIEILRETTDKSVFNPLNKYLRYNTHLKNNYRHRENWGKC